MKKDASGVLFYEKPASNWNEALPIGNGRLGAMVFGDPENEHLALNLDELWSGVPKKIKPVWGAIREAIPKAAEAAENGDNLTAHKLINGCLGHDNSDAYLPFGHLRIRFERDADAGISDFARSLDLRSATAHVVFTQDGKEIHTCAFASFPDKVIVWHLESGKPVSLSVSMDSEMLNEISVEDGVLYLDGVCTSTAPANREMFLEQNYLYDKEPEKHGISYRGGVKAVSSGEVAAENGQISIKNTTEVTLYFTAESNFNGFDKHPYYDGKPYKKAVADILSAAAGKGFDAIYKDHVRDFSSYYDRVKFDLCPEKDFSEVPTNERLVRNAQNHDDTALIALLYNFGRYLTISGSRPGSQPLNLQGIWNAKVSPPWSCNYTTNINVEMNYYPTLACDLPEMHLPLLKMIEELSIAGEETAKLMYGARGFVIHHNTDLWRFSVPAWVQAQASYWPLAGGWLCRHLFDHYLYTGNVGYLKNTALPVMKKCALFHLDTLTETKDGYLVMAPSVSPENKFFEKGEICNVAYTSTMTMSIIRELFENCLKAADLVGENDDEILSGIRKALPKLLPLRIGRQGDLVEWYKDEEWRDVHHRHISHLYGLHPAHEITPDRTPAFSDAAKKTLEIRGDAGVGWSLAWKINFFARLYDGDHALRIINEYLRPSFCYKMGDIYASAPSGTYANLFNACPPMQIDGNFGFVSGINEMLVQFDGENTRILPALPSEWKNGSIKGIRIPGGAKVDVIWKNGELSSFKVTGKHFGKIIYKGKEIKIT